MTPTLKFKIAALVAKFQLHQSSLCKHIRVTVVNCVYISLYCFRYLDLRRDTESRVSDADEISALSSRMTNTLITLEVFDHDTVPELIVRANLMYITKVL